MMPPATMSSLFSRHHTLVALLVLLHWLLAASFSILNPLGEAPDEADHWAYVVYLARERTLPEGPRVTQSKHPPLYHMGAALIASLATPRTDLLRANPDVAIHPSPTQSPNFFVHTQLESWPWQGAARAFHLARLWSTLLSAATVASVYGLARTAFPLCPEVALLATALAATLPELVFIGSSVNNDSAAALFGTLSLWGGFALYRAHDDWRRGWWTGLALGGALLAKVSTVALWPVVALCILLGRVHTPRPAAHLPDRGWLHWVTTGMLVLLPALLLPAPWLLRNWQLYGDPTGMALVEQTIDLRTTGWGWGESRWLVEGWFLSFWGKFGAVGHLTFSSPIYWGFGALMLLGALGLLRGWMREPQVRVPVMLLTLAALSVAFGVWQYSLIALGTDQGRLLFPALGPLLILLALGMASWPWRQWRAAAGRALVITLGLLTLYALLGVVRPAYAPPNAPSPEEVRQAHAPGTPLHFGELSLIGWTLQQNPTLYWQATQPPTQDWRTNIRVTAEDGTLVWEWRRSPGYGRYSTDKWRIDTSMRDVYEVGWPAWAGPGRYRVEVTLYPFGGEPGTAFPYALLGWLEKGE